MKVTDEMIDAFALASPAVRWREDIAAGITAVLAIVERDQAGRCSETLPRLTEFGDLWCQLRHGHLGDHEMGPTRWKGVHQGPTDNGSSATSQGESGSAPHSSSSEVNRG